MLETIQDEILRTARKDYSCSECGNLILKGSKYLHSVMKYDDVYSWRVHPECDKLVCTRPVEYDPWQPEEYMSLWTIWDEHHDEFIDCIDPWSRAMIKLFGGSSGGSKAGSNK